MIKFNAQSLFNSGPAVLHVHALEPRQHAHTAAHGESTSLHSLGYEPRKIEQHGTLLADSPPELRALIQAIENLSDGLAHTLTDDSQNFATEAVLSNTEILPTMAVGTRFKADYTLTYLEPKPIA